MKFISIAAILGLLLSAPFASANTDTIRSLARMTMNLGQPLSEADKASLDAIVDDLEATEEEATIALALSNFDRTVAPGDADRLFEVVHDDLSADEARKLAEILLRLEQKPSDEDAAVLAQLAE